MSRFQFGQIICDNLVMPSIFIELIVYMRDVNAALKAAKAIGMIPESICLILSSGYVLVIAVARVSKKARTTRAHCTSWSLV
jgi:ectoine hydroxylase-related dioxygenase (phytanoyl-CoA dioxygenase family)